jgi:hypothetical protein
MAVPGDQYSSSSSPLLAPFFFLAFLVFRIFPFTWRNEVARNDEFAPPPGKL